MHPRILELLAALALLLLLLGVRGVEITASSPILFIVLVNVSESAPEYLPAARGISLRSVERSYVAPKIPIGHPIRHFTGFHHIGVDTDNEQAMHAQIDRWMVRECARARAKIDPPGKSSKESCFVWPSALSYTLPRIDTMTSVLAPIVSQAPPDASEPIVLPPIPSLIPSNTCEGRVAGECTMPACRYFGPILKCRTYDFCGFATKTACEQTGHCRYAYIKRSRRAVNYEWRCVRKA